MAASAAAVLAVSLGYLALAYVGTVVKAPPSNFSILWLATAFVAGALLLTPVRRWWTYLLGLVPAHAVLAEQIQQPPVPLLVAATQIGGNLLLAVATAVAVRVACGPRPRFDSFRSTLVFILVVAAVTGMVNAPIIGLHMMTGQAGDFWLSWRQWMLASIFPAITVIPLMLGAARWRATAEVGRKSRVEMIVLSVALYGLTLLVFGAARHTDYTATLLLAPLPFLLWAAARWDVAGAGLALLVFAGAITARALAGTGPFSSQASLINVVSLQTYLTAASVSLVLLAALMQELRRGAEQLRRSQEQMTLAAAATDTGLWQWDAAAGRLWMTDHCRSMFGFGPGGASSPDAFLDAVHPDDRPRVQAALNEAYAGSDVTTLESFRVARAGDGERWFALRVRAEHDAEGGAVRVSGLFRDITEVVTARRESEQLTRRLLTLQEDERKNIAQALHDSTTQHLVAAGLTLGMLERRSALTDETRPLFQDIRASIARAVDELRASTDLLRPPELDRQGLSEVLRRYVRGFGQRTGLTSSAKIGAAADGLPVEHQQALLRIAQESLANVYRHASASRVRVDLRPYAGEAHLVIKDDGVGFVGGPEDHGADPLRTGVGIPGMVARIRQLGGKIDIRSDERGTIVHVAVVLAAAPGRPPRPERLAEKVL